MKTFQAVLGRHFERHFEILRNMLLCETEKGCIGHWGVAKW